MMSLVLRFVVCCSAKCSGMTRTSARVQGAIVLIVYCMSRESMRSDRVDSGGSFLGVTFCVSLKVLNK